ncbi:MAG: hypothetical protein K2X87_23750, partial [Gemmataceae bacterium]|nr:hypothetical protein [Gemmataceae bacterium]
PKAPIDHLILGLAAARLGDGDTAAARLREADDLTAKAAPSPANPFAHADGDWLDRVEAKWLREELARALDPRLAPEPREARR